MKRLMTAKRRIQASQDFPWHRESLTNHRPRPLLLKHLLRLRILSPAYTVYATKRFIGSRFEDAAKQKGIKKLSNKWCILIKHPLRLRILSPAYAAYATKRFIGRRFEDAAKKKCIKNLTYKVIKAPIYKK